MSSDFPYLFMGSPDLAATILSRLCTELHPPELVVTQPARAKGRGQTTESTPVAVLSGKLGIKCIAVEDANSTAVVSELRAAHPKLILVAAFGQILKEALLTLPEIACLNVHASLLPRWRGASPVQRAIYEGDPETGVTIQRIVKKLDAGDILLQKRTAIGPNETSADLLERLSVLGADALVEAVRTIQSGKYAFTPQDESKVTVAPKIEKGAAWIDWKRTATQIRNQIRAFQPWPVAETRLGTDRLKLFQAEETPSGGLGAGEIRTDHRSHLYVGCGGNSALSLTEIQLENRKRMNVRDFLMAYRGQFPHQHFSGASQ